MSRLVPRSVRESIIDKLTQEAAAVDWDHLLQTDKTILLRQWVSREDVGGVLRPLLGSDAEVRMWLKDVALKRRARASLPGAAQVVRHLFGSDAVTIESEGVKPAYSYVTKGRQRLFVCWGRSANAKHLLWACLRVLVEEGEVGEAYMAFVESGAAPTPRSLRSRLEAIAERCGVAVKWIES